MVAAYGSAVTSDWRTTGICFDVVSRDDKDDLSYTDLTSGYMDEMF